MILADGGVQLASPIETVVAGHRVLTGPRCDPAEIARTHAVIHASHTDRQTTLLLRANGRLPNERWRIEEPNLEEIVLAYLAREATA